MVQNSASLLFRYGRWVLLALIAALVVNVWSLHTAGNGDGVVAAAEETTDEGAKDDDAGNSGQTADEEEEWPLFSLHNLFTLLMLTVLQAVLGFDNLLYISIESKRVPKDRQAYVRRLGIGLAIGLRIILLFAVLSAIKYFQDPFYTTPKVIDKYFGGSFNVHSLIVILGGAFIMYTAMKEIYHMLSIEDLEHGTEKGQRSVRSAVFWIVIMNLIFSFDSILSAMALSNVFAVMATAIIISGLMMIYLADHVAEFLHKNRMYEVLGLFILFIVGVMLVSEGGHLAHIHLYTYKVEPMAKSTFYFVLIILVLIDIVQGRYQRKLAAMRHQEQVGAEHA